MELLDTLIKKKFTDIIDNLDAEINYRPSMPTLYVQGMEAGGTLTSLNCGALMDT